MTGWRYNWVVMFLIYGLFFSFFICFLSIFDEKMIYNIVSMGLWCVIFLIWGHFFSFYKEAPFPPPPLDIIHWHIFHYFVRLIVDMGHKLFQISPLKCKNKRSTLISSQECKDEPLIILFLSFLECLFYELS